MTDQLTRKKIQYTGEVIDATQKRIKDLEKRVAKAEEIGAHKKPKKHKYRIAYEEICESLKRQLEYLDSYSQSYKDLTGKDYIVGKTEEIFGS